MCEHSVASDREIITEARAGRELGYIHTGTRYSGMGCGASTPDDAWGATPSSASSNGAQVFISFRVAEADKEAR